MIIFKEVRYKNFLSTGNDFTTINLNKAKSTLIVGGNGDGKSTIIDAICFALYGKPYRKVTKPQLVNSITGKGLLVELEFSIGTNSYMLRRGIKPNVFEIYQNNNLIDQSSDVKDYQAILDKIIKIDFKSFCQIVILGSANYIPFMELTTADRRAVIENTLSLQIFTLMNSILKPKIVQFKEDYKALEDEIRLTENTLSLLERNEESLKQNNDEIIADKEDQIAAIKTELKDKAKQVEELKEQREAILSTITIDADEVSKSRFDIGEKISEYKKTIADCDKHLSFYNDNNICPTCDQSLEADHKHFNISGLEKSKTEAYNAKVALEAELDVIVATILEVDSKQKAASEITTKIKEIVSESKYKITTMDSITNEITALKAKTQENSNVDEINKTKSILNALYDTKDRMHEEKDLLEASLVLLKDGGLKTKLVKEYIPKINSILNGYLSDLDFFVHFELDENFNETIKSRHRDKFSYSSFSEGEKQRIDLALMLTWRDITKIRNAASTNLLFMDEILDNSMDSIGVDNLCQILNKKDKDTNIFVISHSEKMVDKFHASIKFKKIKNFSRMI